MRDSLLIILSKYMNSTTITLNEFIHMCERKGHNPRKWACLNIFAARFMRHVLSPPHFLKVIYTLEKSKNTVLNCNRKARYNSMFNLTLNYKCSVSRWPGCDLGNSCKDSIISKSYYRLLTIQLFCCCISILFENNTTRS